MSSYFDEEAMTEGGNNGRASPNTSAAAPDSGEVILKWDNLVYEVKTKVNKQSTVRRILHNISGEVRAGEAIALIGSSGAGKTTLLNALSGRIVGGELSGNILFRGAKRNPGSFKRLSAYVQQDDLMHPLLSVQETLTYASKLRLPNSHYTPEQKAERVNTVIRQLRLESAKNTRIGDATVRGISGGERKRVSIGTELLTDPKLLFLDEPTSGLDSNSSEMVVELVKKISVEQNTATIMTIHQPSARIFNIFDKVILLSQGRLVYFGPTSESISYFASIGYQCPVHENPADYFVDLMTLDHRSEEALARSQGQVDNLVERFVEYTAQNSTGSNSEKQSVASGYRGKNGMAVYQEDHMPRNNWLYEYCTLARRDWINAGRNTPFVAGQAVQAVFMALLIGFIFFYLKHDALSINNRLGAVFIICVNATFPVIMPMLTLYYKERDIMVRERSSATYRVTSFYMSKLTTFIPIALIANTVFFTGVYFISHLAFDAGKFFIGLATFYSLITVSVAFFLMVGSGIKSQEFGFVVAPIILTIQILFGGLFANPHTITPVLRWIRWVNPVQYAFSSLTQNEFRGLEFVCKAGTQCYTTGAQVIEAYSVGRFTVWQNILLLLMLAFANIILRLETIRKTQIGDAKVRGVSGGERKRVSIGTELLTDPSLLFLDEPTSGLDSNSSQLVVELVKDIATQRQMAVLMTIHQPSAKIFNNFDKVILLSQGHLVYFGPTKSAIGYFSQIGYQCPVHENPADFFIDLMTLDFRSDAALVESRTRVAGLVYSFMEYNSKRASQPERARFRYLSDHDVATAEYEANLEIHNRNSWISEYQVLARRDWVNLMRNFSFLISQAVQSLMTALLVGFMFYYLKHDAVSVQNRLGVLYIIALNATFPTIMPALYAFFEERDIMLRERSSGVYRVTTFYVAKATTFVPISLMSSTIFITGVYFISHLTFSAAKFFITLSVLSCLNMVSIAFMLMIGSAVKNMDIAFVVAPAIVTIELLFGGLLANPTSIVPAIRWVRWINPVYYAFSAFIQNEFQGLTFECSALSQCYPNGEQVIAAYGMGRFTILQNTILLLFIGIIFYASGYVLLRWRAKPKYICI
ncbi:hypothetical protein J3B02_001596 [Coemansia erecta]|nr:hypothetical protein J3B02_001596 [Coemansia erecta]